MTIEAKQKPIPGKPETWPKKVVGPNKCLCGSESWHRECYLAVKINYASPRSIISHGGM